MYRYALRTMQNLAPSRLREALLNVLLTDDTKVLSDYCTSDCTEGTKSSAPRRLTSSARSFFSLFGQELRQWNGPRLNVYLRLRYSMVINGAKVYCCRQSPCMPRMLRRPAQSAEREGQLGQRKLPDRRYPEDHGRPACSQETRELCRYAEAIRGSKQQD